MNVDGAKSHGHLIAPHGGELVDLMLNPESALELKMRSRDFPSWDLTSRQIRDLELLISGGFSPLRGFMNRDEYERLAVVWYSKYSGARVNAPSAVGRIS